MNEPPFLHQLRHQLIHILKQLLYPTLLFFVLLWVRFDLRPQYDPTGRYAVYDWRNSIVVVLLLAGLWMIVTILKWQTPGNSDTAVLTRPLNRKAGIWAQWLAFGITIALPVLLLDILVNQGYGYSWVNWLGVVLTSLLLSGSLMASMAALLCLVHSQRQFMFILMLIIVAVIFWSAFAPRKVEIGWQSYHERFTSIAPTFMLLVTALISWWISMLRGPRKAAVSLFLIGLLQWPLSQSLLATCIRGPSVMRYNAATSLKLRLGAQEPAYLNQGQLLWPNLSVTGLKPGEVATIVALSPVEEGKSWPSKNEYSDFDERGVRKTDWVFSNWLNSYHYIQIAAQNTYMDKRVYISSNKRPDLRELIKNNSPKTKWKLRLAIHTLKKVTAGPLSKWTASKEEMALKPGLKLEVIDGGVVNGFPAIHGRISFSRPGLLMGEITEGYSGISGERWLPQPIFVFRSLESRDCFTSSGNSKFIDRRTNLTSPWSFECAFSIGIMKPTFSLRNSILEIQDNDKNLQEQFELEIWITEERGLVDLEINPAEIQDIIKAENAL